MYKSELSLKYIAMMFFVGMLTILPVGLVCAQDVSIDDVVESALDEVDESFRERVVIDTLEYKNEDVHTVLEAIAQKGRLNIVTGPNVIGKVSIFLKDVEAMDALRIVMDTNDLVFNEEDGVIRVLTAQEFKERYGYEYTQTTKTKMIPILHADPEEILEVMNQMKSDAGKIIFNDQIKTFIVIDTPEQISSMDTYVKKVDVPIERRTIELKHIEPLEAVAEIQDMLSSEKSNLEVDSDAKTITIIDKRTVIEEIVNKVNELDQPERKIRLTTKILQIILNDEHTKGVDWEAIVSDYFSLEFLGMKNTIVGKDGAISLGTVTSEDLVVLLDALETVGDISELDDTEKTILRDETALISVNGLDAVNLSDDKSDFETKDREEDVRFYIQPTGYGDNKIDIFVKPEVFSLAEKTTSIKVEEGSAIVIGGLYKNVTVRTERKIPLLGDIPLIRDVPFSEIPILGFAFRNQKKSIRKTEVIVFITAETISEK